MLIIFAIGNIETECNGNQGKEWDHWKIQATDIPDQGIYSL